MLQPHSVLPKWATEKKPTERPDVAPDSLSADRAASPNGAEPRAFRGEKKSFYINELCVAERVEPEIINQLTEIICIFWLLLP